MFVSENYLRTVVVSFFVIEVYFMKNRVKYFSNKLYNAYVLRYVLKHTYMNGTFFKILKIQ